MPRPTRPKRWRRNARKRREFQMSETAVSTATSVPDLGIQESVDDVDQYVHHHEQERAEHERADDDGRVAPGNGRNHGPAEARPVEDGFRDDGTSEKVADVQADYRHDGNHGVAQLMPEDDPLAGQPFGEG